MNHNNDLRTSEEIIEHIKRWEGFRGKAYRCPAGILTIGYGHTSDAKYEVQLHSKVNKSEADRLLRHDIKEAESIVKKDVSVPLTRNQFSALVSFVFNRGSLHFYRRGERVPTTMLRKLNNGDYLGAAREFPKWCNARDPKTGKLRPLKGLINRRNIEMEIFMRPDEKKESGFSKWRKNLQHLSPIKPKPHKQYGEPRYENSN